MEVSDKERTVIGKAVHTVLVPVHAAASKPARKAYLSTFLFVTASVFLFVISSVAYALFYYNYVPQIGVERIIHLQFGDGSPHGTASLSSALTFNQAYDISLILHLPRTANNLAAGNFMLDLSLLSPNVASSASDTITSAPSFSNPNLEVLARSRRPAILTYASPIIDTASTLSGLPWYILGWKKESESLKVSMFEGVEFAKGWKNVPQSVKIAVESDLKMQFYNVGIEIVAKFGGLRWILYHHRIFSFFFFTTTFWASTMLSALVAWFFISTYFSSAATKPEPTGGSKPEPSDTDFLDPFSTEDLSDTARAFPTLSRQMPPLHYPPPARREPDQPQQPPQPAGGGIKDDEERSIKKEEEDEVRLRSLGIPPPLLEPEADDEDEDDEDMESAAWRDSGIGTSRDDPDRNMGVHRRRRAPFGGSGRV